MTAFQEDAEAARLLEEATAEAGWADYRIGFAKRPATAWERRAIDRVLAGRGLVRASGEFGDYLAVLQLRHEAEELYEAKLAALADVGGDWPTIGAIRGRRHEGCWGLPAEQGIA